MSEMSDERPPSATQVDACVRVRGARGDARLVVRFTPSGPVLSLSGASLELEASSELSLSCETLRICTAKGTTIAVGGALSEQVLGSVRRTTAGESVVSARTISLEAPSGGVEVHANDDISLSGERILLNSDDETPRTRLAPGRDTRVVDEALLEAASEPPDQGD